jgi:hypothetical protein
MKAVRGHLESQPKVTSKRAVPSPKVLVGSHRIKKFGLQMGPPTVAHRPRRSRKFGVEALADGFEGLESSLPANIPQIPLERKRRCAGKEVKRNPSSRQLQLVGGFLPQPYNPFGSIDKDGGINPSQLQLTNSQFLVASRPTAVDPHNHLHNSITTQFSNVTAPAREESDSDSESSRSYCDLGGENYQYGTGDESGGCGSSSVPGKFHSGPVPSCYAQGEPSYFGDAIFHLNATENDFWSQYGGMD